MCTAVESVVMFTAAALCQDIKSELVQVCTISGVRMWLRSCLLDIITELVQVCTTV